MGARRENALSGDASCRKLELKVDLSKSDVDRLAGELAGGDLGIGPATTEKLKTVYFDTPEHDLHAAGISLRLAASMAAGSRQ